MIRVAWKTESLVPIWTRPIHKECNRDQYREDKHPKNHPPDKGRYVEEAYDNGGQDRVERVHVGRVGMWVECTGLSYKVE